MSLSLSTMSSRASGAGGLGLSFGGAGLGMGGGMGGGLGLGLGAGLGLGSGLGLGGSAGLGLGGGAGVRLGLGGAGLGLGGGAGLGAGAGGGAMLLGLGGGGGGGGALMASPAFSMGRTMAAGGMSAGASLVAASVGAGAPATLAPFLSRADEKSTLSRLNDRFAGFMARVKELQKENGVLEARLAQLTGSTDTAVGSAGPAAVAEQEILQLEYRGKVESLTLDTVKLEIELDGIRGIAHEIQAKFEFEQGVRFQLEADIAAMKRDIEMASELRAELDDKKANMKEELTFVSKMQEEELVSIQGKLGKTSSDVSVSMIEVDTDKSFDVAAALHKMRTQYETSVQQHREEAEAYYKLKMDEIQTASASSSAAISATKEEISTAKKELQVLVIELQGLVGLSLNLESRLSEALSISGSAVSGYQSQIAGLEIAIASAKADMHKQILSYQELLDIKLALDAEIATYRALLDGGDFSAPIPTDISFTPATIFLSKSPPASVRSASPLISVQAETAIDVETALVETTSETLTEMSYTATETVIETKEVTITEEHTETTASLSDAEDSES